MPKHSAPPANDVPRFCPFCRECFEGIAECPEHDLALVDFQDLPRTRSNTVPEDNETLALTDMRFGRGWVTSGSFLVLLGFFLPFLRLEQTETLLTLEVATQRAHNLWSVFFVGLGLVSVAYRQNSLRKMRGARLVVLCLPLLVLGSLGYTGYAIRSGMEIAARFGEVVQVEPLWGGAVIALGAVLTIVGAFRYGVVPEDSAA